MKTDEALDAAERKPYFKGFKFTSDIDLAKLGEDQFAPLIEVFRNLGMESGTLHAKTAVELEHHVPA